jgi:Helix-turn-helix domain/WD40-like Beta Propeller Repeat
MPKPSAPISLADLSAAGIRLRPYEVVTIVRELILLVARGDVAGVPSAHVIRLSSSGALSVEGPVGAGGPSVARAAQLLESLLPTTTDADPQFRIPGALKLVVARGLGVIDLPPFMSLDSFADELNRFGSSDPAETLAKLATAWANRVPTREEPEPAPVAEAVAPSALAPVEPFVTPRGLDASSDLTVSDIRRARRATGLPLKEVAVRSHIPVGLLRQLEWGYLQNWPAGHYGRTQLVRYARAAGLDDQVVVSTIMPLLVEAEQRRGALVHRPQVQDLPAPVVEPVVEVEILHTSRGRSDFRIAHGSRWRRALAALAIPALLAIGLLPGWWARSSTGTGIPPSVERVGPSDRPSASAAPVPERVPVAASTESKKPDSGTRAVVATPEASPVAAKSGTTNGIQSDTVTTPDTRAAAARDPRADGGGEAPSFEPVGTAMFSPAAVGGAVVPAGSDNRDTLRITKIVDDPANNAHLRMSPDGERIAFDSDRDGIRGVYVADANGGRVRRVSGEGVGAVPSWSPDGNRLAFMREEPSRPSVWNVWTLDLGSDELKRITSHESGQPWGASWFPDGHRIAYSHADRIIVRDLTNGAERIFPFPRRGRALRAPVVSPDGRRMVFHVDRDGAWLLELGDSSMRRVLEDPTAEGYTWSPDGRRLAYHSRRKDAWGVWMMAPR